MFYAPLVDRSPALHEVACSAAAAWDEGDAEVAADEDRFDVTRRNLTQLEVGQTVYELRSSRMGTFLPGRIGEDGEFFVPGFFPEIIGRGRTIDGAFLDWRDRIHARFQELYAKRPFEMNGPERATWALLESQIDVDAYRAKTPLTIRQKGRVDRSRPLPEMVEWEDGLKEKVQLDQMPGEFATYKAGQPFEAIVARDPRDFHLLKVTYIQRICPLPRVSTDEISSLLHSVPTSSSLPDADWN